VKKKGFGWFFFHNKATLNIYIPEDYDRNMDIDLGSGNLEFSGDSKSEPMKLRKLSLDLGSGNVKLKNLEVKNFEYDGSSGDAEIHSMAVQSGSIDISSGSLVVKGYTGGLEADVSSGHLEAQLDELINSIDIEVSSGEVDLDLPDNAGFTLNGKAGSGDISCNFPLKDQETDKNKIKGTHGSGEHKIDLNVSSGNINLY
jgi:lia operon protein LiaG